MKNLTKFLSVCFLSILLTLSFVASYEQDYYKLCVGDCSSGCSPKLAISSCQTDCRGELYSDYYLLRYYSDTGWGPVGYYSVTSETFTLYSDLSRHRDLGSEYCTANKLCFCSDLTTNEQTNNPPTICASKDIDFYVWSPNAAESLGDFDANSDAIIDDPGVGSCCGDDDYNDTILSSTYDAPYRWCVRPGVSCLVSNCQAPSEEFYPASYQSGVYSEGYKIYYTSPTAYKTGQTCEAGMGGEVLPTNEVCGCRYLQVKRKYLDDPDMGLIACYQCELRNEKANPSFRMWDAVVSPSGNGCCGDDAWNEDDGNDDCYYAFGFGSGLGAGQKMCMFFEEKWYWKTSNDANIPGITYKSPNNYEVLSTRYKFLICVDDHFEDNTTNPRDTYNRASVTLDDPDNIYSLNSHEYICYGKKIYECCGDDPCQCNNEAVEHSDTTGNDCEKHTGEHPGPNENLFCTSGGTWVGTNEYDLSEEVCEDSTPNKYDWTDNPGKCCGDDHDAYYEISGGNADGDNVISDCLDFDANEFLCIQEGGWEDTSGLPQTPDCDDELSCITCDSPDAVDCCICNVDPDWPCECEFQPCHKDDNDCDPAIGYGWDCEEQIGEPFNKYPPFARMNPDPAESDQDLPEHPLSDWSWLDPKRWPGYIYYVGCAKYPVVSRCNTQTCSDSDWYSCTNYTISNAESGFRLHEYPYSTGYIPDISGNQDPAHLPLANHYTNNPSSIAGRIPSTNTISSEEHGYLCYVENGNYKIKECCNSSVEDDTLKGYCNSQISFTAGLGDSEEYFLPTSGSAGAPATYYCTSDYTWSVDLDVYERTCNVVHASDGAIGWTGSYCCGDNDDNPEYYNDPGPNSPGACWNGTFQESGNYVQYPKDPPGENYGNIFVVNGTFHGCMITDPLLTSLQHCPAHPNSQCTNDPLFTWDFDLNRFNSHSAGETLTDVELYCDAVTGEWMDSFGVIWHQSSILPLLEAEPEHYNPDDNCPSWWTEEGTCESDRCWMGCDCVNSFTIQQDPISPTNYRCINGDWVESKIKYTWDRYSYGYCPREDQCLVNPGGNPDTYDVTDYEYTTLKRDYATQGIYGGLDEWYVDKNDQSPICIDNDQYIGDNYCENGVWSSRTKYVATQLLNYASSTEDYTLFCDNYWRALNKYKDISLPTGDLEMYLEQQCKNPDVRDDPILCTNKICVLKYYDYRHGEHIIFGVTLNAPINTPTARSPAHKNFLEVLGIDDPTICDNAMGTTTFTRCTGASDLVYYNDKYTSLIFSNKEIELLPTVLPPDPESWLDYFISLIKLPIESIINYLLGTVIMYPSGAGAIPLDFIFDTTRFDRIFIDVKPDGKVITAINEKVRYYEDEYVYDEYMAINYYGFTVNICDSLNQFSQYHQSEGYRYDRYSGSDYNELNCSIGSDDSYYVISRRPVGVAVGFEVNYYGDGYKWIGEDIWDDLTEQLRVQ